MLSAALPCLLAALASDSFVHVASNDALIRIPAKRYHFNACNLTDGGSAVVYDNGDGMLRVTRYDVYLQEKASIEVAQRNTLNYFGIDGLHAGGYVVVFIDEVTHQTRMVLYNESDVNTTDTLIDNPPNEHYHPSVSVAPDGSIVVLWGHVGVTAWEFSSEGEKIKEFPTIISSDTLDEGPTQYGDDVWNITWLAALTSNDIAATEVRAGEKMRVFLSHPTIEHSLYNAYSSGYPLLNHRDCDYNMGRFSTAAMQQSHVCPTHNMMDVLLFSQPPHAPWARVWSYTDDHHSFTSWALHPLGREQFVIVRLNSSVVTVQIMDLFYLFSTGVPMGVPPNDVFDLVHGIEGTPHDVEVVTLFGGRLAIFYRLSSGSEEHVAGVIVGSPIVPTSVPTTEAPPTPAPPTNAPQTAAPPTSAPATDSPPTSAPPTDAPPTSAPPTSAPPTVAPTAAPLTAAPLTPAPPTAAPPTSAPPTLAPTTSVPLTSAPPTLAPTTSVPLTSAPPTLAPPTSAPSTSAPFTLAPPTSAPPTSAPPTPAPLTLAPPTPAPPTSAPPTSAPLTLAPPTSAPPTSAPLTPAPPTSAPLTSAPPTLAPPTSAPLTSAPSTLAPPTSAPPTPAPLTPAPPTSAPLTSAPYTSAPPTSAPLTRAPLTSAPLTPAPTTSAPPTSAPETPEPTEQLSISFGPFVTYGEENPHGWRTSFLKFGDFEGRWACIQTRVLPSPPDEARIGSIFTFEGSTLLNEIDLPYAAGNAMDILVDSAVYLYGSGRGIGVAYSYIDLDTGKAVTPFHLYTVLHYSITWNLDIRHQERSDYGHRYNMKVESYQYGYLFVHLVSEQPPTHVGAAAPQILASYLFSHSKLLIRDVVVNNNNYANEAVVEHLEAIRSGDYVLVVWNDILSGATWGRVMDTDLAFGAVFRIDEEATPGTDRNHVIAALEAGEWVVAWSSVNEQTGETSVRSRKVDYLRTLGEEKFHDSLSADAQVAGHENGGYVVAYGVDTQWFSSGGLKLKFYDSDDKFIDERSVPYDIHVDGVPDSPHRTLLATGLIHIGYNDYALSFTIINGDSLAGATLHPFMASTIISWL